MSAKAMKHYTYFNWTELEIGDRFRVAGYDDLLQKISETHAKALGAPWLKRPVCFARRGERVLMSTPGADASGLILSI
jgi:hypothetical protein